MIKLDNVKVINNALPIDIIKPLPGMVAPIEPLPGYMIPIEPLPGIIALPPVEPILY